VTAQQLRELDTSLVVAGGEYRDTEFVVSSRYTPTSQCAALYGPDGISRLVFRNCTIRTPFRAFDPSWQQQPWWKELAGLRLAGPRDWIVDGLTIEGFPGCAIAASRVDRAKLEHVAIERCWMGGSFGWEGRANRNVRIDDFKVRDLWGGPPASGDRGVPSRCWPGSWCGGDGLAGYFEDFLFTNLDLGGEMYGGLKLVRSKRGCLIDVATNTMMIQGTIGRDGNPDGTIDGSEQIAMRGLMIDKARGRGDGTDRANALQVSFNVRGLDVEGYSILAGGHDGHGIELHGDCEASFRGGIIEGFNGKRFEGPAYALHVSDGSRVNADFEAVNQFSNQQRVRLPA
jgi:hypothetical protein